MEKKRVLVVDDAAFMRMIVKDAITALGHEVIGEAENGQEAIEKYESLKPDLVTMDLVMPVSSGTDGLKGIIANDPKAKVIIISAIDQRQNLIEAIKLGAHDFIVKPFEQDRLANAIKKAFGA